MIYDRPLNDVPRNDLEAFVASLRDILWPDKDPDAEWGPGTLEAIGYLCGEFGLGPDS